MRRLILALLRGYQLTISPLLGPRCRFHPSCSDYAMQAVSRHGVLRGGYLSARRVLKCHPFHPGGYDPVPDADHGETSEQGRTSDGLAAQHTSGRHGGRDLPPGAGVEQFPPEPDPRAGPDHHDTADGRPARTAGCSRDH